MIDSCHFSFVVVEVSNLSKMSVTFLNRTLLTYVNILEVVELLDFPKHWD